ncbi:MAG: hypothetical protein ACHQQQ_00100 [Bacteroidota bacterium]
MSSPKLVEYTKSALVSEFELLVLQDMRKYINKRLFGSVAVSFREGTVSNYERKETENVGRFNLPST